MKEVIYFGATWCGPCQKLGPIIEELRAENPEIPFRKVDIDEDVELTRLHKVFAVPTLVCLEEDAEVGRVSGLRPKKEIAAALKL